MLPGLNYAVFGLGNKTYEHYNAMGIYVDKRLEELGGKRIHELGKGPFIKSHPAVAKDLFPTEIDP